MPTCTVTIVLVTFVHIRIISAVTHWPDFDQTLKVGTWDHLEQSPTTISTKKKLKIKDFLQEEILPKKMFANKNCQQKIFAEKRINWKQNLKKICQKQLLPKQKFSGKKSLAEKVFSSKNWQLSLTSIARLFKGYYCIRLCVCVF